MPSTQNLEHVGDSDEKDEIERTWIPDALPIGLDRCRRELIKQFYTEQKLPQAVVRFRWQGPEFYRVVKTGKGLVRREKTTRIAESEYRANQLGHSGDMITKYRHYWLGSEGLVYEIDVFTEQLSGRIKIEVEFQTLEQAQLFQPLLWFGREVTGDARYGNFSLAMNGWPTE